MRSSASKAIVVFLFLGTAVAIGFGVVRPPKPPLRIAFQVCNSLEENEARFEPLRAWLERKLGRQVVVTHVNTFDVAEVAAKREADIVQSNGYIYVTVKAKSGATLVAREVKLDTGKETGGLVVVRADSPAKALADLRGKTMVYGPVLSPGGYLTQYDSILSAGLDPEELFSKYTFLPGAWQHERVVYSVLHGGADAGAVKVGDIERMDVEGKVRKADFRVIASSPPVPNCVVYALPHVDLDTVRAVRDLLLTLSDADYAESGGERLNVLRRDAVKGYVATDDREFDILRTMAKKAKLPPYDEASGPSTAR